MILTILNNPRQGLKLIVLWLIFGIGLLPDTTEGLKCYKCDGAACKNAPPDIDCASGYCLTINKGKDSEKKDCAASAKEGECIKGKGGCFTGTDDNKADMDTCLGTEAKSDVGTGTEICVCEGDHCNGEKKAKGTPNGGGRTDDDTTPAVDQKKKGKCYECLEGDCKKDPPRKQVDCDSIYCKTVSSGGGVVEKSCFDSATIAENCYGGNKCLTQQKENECTGKDEKGSAKICVCQGDLCNTGQGSGSDERIISNSFLVYLLMGISAKAI